MGEIDDAKTNIGAELEIVEPDTPWTLAWQELRAGNPIPLGDLLKNGGLPPADTCIALGNALAPPEGYQNIELRVEHPDRLRNVGLKLGGERKIRQRYEVLVKKYGKSESAISEIRKETGKSRATITNYIRNTDLDLVLLSEIYLGNVDPETAKAARASRARRRAIGGPKRSI